MLDPRAISRGTARVIPVVILAIIAYAAYALIGPLCVNDLLENRDNPTRSRRVAIALLVIFCYLLLLVVPNYVRMLIELVIRPDYTARTEAWMEANTVKPHLETRPRGGGGGGKKGLNRELIGVPYGEMTEGHRPTKRQDQPGLEYFYNKEAFCSEGDGRPPWCSVCHNWKPDRAHHCSDINRCVMRMDHFCPWVGGVVSERNLKFFMQFVFHTCVFTLFLLIVSAYYVAEQNRRDSQTLNPHLVALLALAALFFIFSLGMTLATGRGILENQTSIETLNSSIKVWTIAVHLPNPPVPGTQGLPYKTITFPLQPNPNIAPRTFAILHSNQGDNPFDLGPYNNWTSIMGETIWEWLFPFKHSPICSRDRSGSEYPMGPAFNRMKESHGITKSTKNEN